jgi:hypothetical protein
MMSPWKAASAGLLVALLCLSGTAFGQDATHEIDDVRARAIRLQHRRPSAVPRSESKTFPESFATAADSSIACATGIIGFADADRGTLVLSLFNPSAPPLKYYCVGD